MLGRDVLGRDTETGLLGALLRDTAGGHGGGVVLHGEPGIGKTALLSYAEEQAIGFQVLRAVGVAPEADLAYATLHQLLLPALGSVDDLPGPQAQALHILFGRAHGAPPDPFLVGLSTLSLLSLLAGEKPVLCVIDDAHWVDRPTLKTVAFVARRLANEPIALALAARADEGHGIDLPDLRRIPLMGLKPEAATALLAQRAGERPLTGGEQQHLLVATGGNPLALLELAGTELPPEGAQEPLATGVLAEASGRNLADAMSYARRALGLIDLVAGRHQEAARHFEAVGGWDTDLAMGIVPDLVEALVRAGERDRAAAATDRYAEWTKHTDSPALGALAARCRALVATDGAEVHYTESLRLHAMFDAPLECARTELLLGEQLRRDRRRSDAQQHLRGAAENFRRIGALAWADRALGELRATGESAGTPDAGALSTLTPQELRITLAVGEGRTNREIAAQLFLSPRTVDYHLRKVFQKADLTSRAELMRLVLAERPA